MLQPLNAYLHKHKLTWAIPIYGVFYVLLFRYLERRPLPKSAFHLISCPLDQYIPFCKYFVVFYLSWFIFVFLAFGYFLVVNRDTLEFNKFGIMLSIGMTFFLFFSLFWPNRLDLRPVLTPGSDIFTHLLNILYHHDTPTNVFPSIHVFNSAVIWICFRRSTKMQKKKYRPALYVVLIWAILIICSTVLIKQHSLYDVLAGLAMAFILELVIYRPFRKSDTASPEKS